MKICPVSDCRYNAKNTAIPFMAGIVNLYSDFDGTFLPHEYRHDVFCRLDGQGPRDEFLKSGKDGFRAYFDDFQNFMNTLKGKNKDKFNFIITTGRNRPEYNYFIKRVKDDGFSMPLPDKLVIRNGGDIYTKRKDIKDYFLSDEAELFLKNDFVKEKRREIKKLSGWDGKTVRKIIYDTIKAKMPYATTFVADTESWFYGSGMHFSDKLKAYNLSPNCFVALKENGDLNFHIILPSKVSTKDTLESLSEDLAQKINDDSINTIIQSRRPDNIRHFGQIMLFPNVHGVQLNKLYDTKKQVETIIKEKSNDLVIVAGDDVNDVKMLNFFEYINSKGFGKDNLEKIYNLPLIAVFVDNSRVKNKPPLKVKDLPVSFDEIDNYFNSDGNVRFIHVVPNNNVGKPKTLKEGIEIAIKEYSKRNPEFRKNLSPEAQEMIKNSTLEYPIDRTVSSQLEKELNTTLWNPFNKEIIYQEQVIENSSLLKTPLSKTPLSKKILPAFILLGLGLLILKNIISKNKKRKDIIQPVLYNAIKNSLEFINKEK